MPEAEGEGEEEEGGVGGCCIVWGEGGAEEEGVLAAVKDGDSEGEVVRRDICDPEDGL